MKNSSKIPFILYLSLLIVFPAMMNSCKLNSPPAGNQSTVEVIESNPEGSGPVIQIRFIKGKLHNYPLMAIWMADTNGRYLQTLFIAESIGKGVFNYGNTKDGKWEEGPKRRPAALPVWGHQYGYQAPDGYYLPDQNNPVPDAYTGPTPKNNFILKAKANKKVRQPFMVFFEINQSWDWNEFWTNNKFPDDDHYKTSSQPALVYSATLNPKVHSEEIEMTLIGRSHHSGSNGEIYDDLETITTAKQIARRISVEILSD